MTAACSGCSPQHQWSVIPADDVDDWNRRLLATSASYYQFPFWNEPFRQMRFRPVYLRYGPAASPLAYACILSFGVPGFRIGLLQLGPVILHPDQQVDAAMFVSLARWLRRRGYVLLRIDPPDAKFAELLSTGCAGKVVLADMFPFLGIPRQALLVDQQDDDATLASFKSTARWEIRTAERHDYEVRISDTVEELERAWPLIETTAQRKGFTINRSLSNWRIAFELGRRHNCVRVCTVYLHDRPVQTVVLVRDGVQASYVYGGIDLEALGDNPPPGCLLHWRGMREIHRLGCKTYDLGQKGDEKLFIFKRKFRPAEHLRPRPITLVTNRLLFPLWSKGIMGGLLPLWPRLKPLVTRFLR